MAELLVSIKGFAKKIVSSEGHQLRRAAILFAFRPFRITVYIIIAARHLFVIQFSVSHYLEFQASVTILKCAETILKYHKNDFL